MLTDIEAILTKGEKDTKALNEKMQQFTDNAMKFTMDGGIENVYDFKDEEEEVGGGGGGGG
jgi:SWI/SNF-related matrix-associated actin-dependent regulator of chromatin subfamily A member 5